jgi:hypothetical protein
MIVFIQWRNRAAMKMEDLFVMPVIHFTSKNQLEKRMPSMPQFL